MKRFIFVVSLFFLGYFVYAQCPIPATSFVGDYNLLQTTPASAHPFAAPTFNNQVVSLSVGTTANSRVFSAVYLESLGIGQAAMEVKFTLDCPNGNSVVVDNGLDTFLTCGSGAVTLGPAATTGVFNVNDFSSFTLILAEFVNNGGCAVPTPIVTEFQLSKVCEAPQNISFTNSTPTSVVVNWDDPNPFAATFDIEYGLSGFTPGTGMSITGLTGTSTTVNNLQPNTAYDFYFISNCGVNGVSTTNGPINYFFAPNPDFFIDPVNNTCKCPNAAFGDIGTLVLNGQTKTFTKRTRADLDAIISNDINDPQIELTCTTGITDMSNLFFNQTGFNQNISHWDVSNVTVMFRMFNGASSFNQDISNWDVSNVTDMSFMFSGATSFNQPIGSWDVSNVTNISAAFNFASSFNQPIENWVLSNATNMSSMFSGATSFNQPIGSWDVSNVTNISFMFSGATSFNQPIGNWDVSNVTNMASMFNGASSFNQDISTWQFNSSITNFESFVAFTNLSVNNYDALLQQFDSLNLVGVTLISDILGYCDTVTRDNLIFNKSWSISGDTFAQCGQVSTPSTLPFQTVWNVPSTDLTIDIYTFDIFDYDFSIDWGDGNVQQNITSTISHTYTNPGSYTVSITGIFPHFSVCDLVSESTCSNSDKLTGVLAWGDQQWRSMFQSFGFTGNITLPATEAPDLSLVNDLIKMFRASQFNQSLNHWDVSNVESLRQLFLQASDFNQSLNNWDVSNVTNMAFMFNGASSFNQSIDNLNVSNVINMSNMFSGASSFNQPIGNWDVSNVTNIQSMFSNASSFNQPLNTWDVSSVINMSGLFNNADSFNQPIGNWDVSNVTDMSFIFNFNDAFNQDISNWDVSSVTNMRQAFTLAVNFNQPLNSWDVSNVTDMTNMFNGATSFNQDLTDWCVEQFPTKPPGFNLNSAQPVNFEPLWGQTCQTLSLIDFDANIFSIYPNPASSVVNFSINDTVKAVRVYNISGQLLMSEHQTNDINVQALKEGLYLLQFDFNDGTSTSKKLIIQR